MAKVENKKCIFRYNLSKAEIRCMNPDFRMTDGGLWQLDRSQKVAKREKYFCQIKGMV